MVPISKGNAPAELADEIRAIRRTPDAEVCYRNLGSRTRSAVLDSLLREQGWICAYCMQRIEHDSAHIEHLVPQSISPGELSVDYRNMLAVCDGNEGSPLHELTCDRSKGGRQLSVLNPLSPQSLSGIKYYVDGRIGSDRRESDNDLNTILNLNCREANLPQRRAAVVKKLNRKLDSIGSRRGARAVMRFCRERKRFLENPEEKRSEFVGVELYFLERRLRRGTV